MSGRLLRAAATGLSGGWSEADGTGLPIRPVDDADSAERAGGTTGRAGPGGHSRQASTPSR